jgi:hypothetical protein
MASCGEQMTRHCEMPDEPSQKHQARRINPDESDWMNLEAKARRLQTYREATAIIRS